MLQRYTGSGIGTRRLIAEGLLKGEQVTVEGFVHNGKASIMGVVDSVMFPGTLAFARFDYPSSLPDRVQQRMAEIAATLMPGLGFDNGLFNIEMMYDPDADLVSIIEINPRMASQFADLYEKVDGTNSYAVLLDIAQGRAPRFKRRQGRYAFAASIVLRSFEDRLVTALPSATDLDRLARDYPDIRARASRQGRACAFVRIAGREELSLRHRQSRGTRPHRGARRIRGLPGSSRDCVRADQPDAGTAAPRGA